MNINLKKLKNLILITGLFAPLIGMASQGQDLNNLPEMEIQNESKDDFANSYKSLMEDTSKQDGVESKDLLAAFEVYYSQIGGGPATA